MPRLGDTEVDGVVDAGVHVVAESLKPTGDEPPDARLEERGHVLDHDDAGSRDGGPLHDL